MNLRAQLMRWHRRVGLASAVVVVLLVVTGILLNHTERLGWGHQPVGTQWLQSWYGVEPEAMTSYRAGNHWYSFSESGKLYRDGVEISWCEPPEKSALGMGQLELVVCGNEMLLIAPSGEVVERISAVHGLPAPERLGMDGKQLHTVLLLLLGI